MDSETDLIDGTLGNYLIVSILGKGGMGTVYLGVHNVIGHKAAIKVLRSDLARQPEPLARFFYEAKSVNLVKHPNIVQIFDYGEDPSVGAFMVMEFLEGESLGSRIQREGRLEVSKVARVVSRVAAALHAVHKKDLLHRDLKPDNIFLVPDSDHPGEDRVKVLDFGIAKLLDQTRTGVQTEAGIMVGTPAYMSPEYIRGEREVDHRSDIYALGLIAYEALCGRPPFRNDAFQEVLLAHIGKAPTPLSELNPAVNRDVEAVVLKALAKEPDDRYQSMRGFGSALLTAAGLVNADEGQQRMKAMSTEIISRVDFDPKRPSTLSVSAVELRSTTKRRRRSRVALFAGLAGVLLAGTLVGFLRFGPLLTGDLEDGDRSARAVHRDGDRDRKDPSDDGESADDEGDDSIRPPVAPGNSGAPESAALTAAPVDATAAAGSPAAGATTLSSDPEGVTVYDAEGVVELGSTPFTAELGGDVTEVTYVLKKKGFRPERVTVSRGDPPITVKLSPARKGKGPKGPKGPKDPGRYTPTLLD